MVFGIWSDVTLMEARAKRDEAKRMLIQGNDSKAEQKEFLNENFGAYTFETIPLTNLSSWQLSKICTYLSIQTALSTGNYSNVLTLNCKLRR